MSELYFTESHEWIRFNNGKAFVGLTGKGLYGDVVYIELPVLGTHVTRGESCASVECLKCVMDVHAPATGIVSGINDTVFDDPDVVVKTPLRTWLFKVDYEGEPDYSGLLVESEYELL